MILSHFSPFSPCDNTYLSPLAHLRGRNNWSTSDPQILDLDFLEIFRGFGLIHIYPNLVSQPYLDPL